MRARAGGKSTGNTRYSLHIDDGAAQEAAADIDSRMQVSERTVLRCTARGDLPVVRLKRAVRIGPPNLACIARNGLPAAGGLSRVPEQRFRGR